MSTAHELQAVSELLKENRIKKGSRDCYNSKLPYMINFMDSMDEYRNQLEYDPDTGEKRLKLPLSFCAITALFSRIMVDTDLPKVGAKRRLGGVDGPVDNTPDKIHSVTVAKTTVTGYKSALKQHYRDRKVKFECKETLPVELDIDEHLNDLIRSYGNMLALKRVSSFLYGAITSMLY